jgi:glycosyltransferase involved in cell wall biosynthesis
MKRVLIPSNNFDFVANLAIGYRSLGFDAIGGQVNFELETGDFDVIHIQWPEEFTDWRAPTPAQIDAILVRLDRWAKRSRLIISVHNLYPHRYHKNPLFHRLYAGFYTRAEVIHHFSHVSKALVCSEYPSTSKRNHVVRLGFNYERLLPSGPRDRVAARRVFGFAADEIVFLVFGTLRFWEEVRLLRLAFRRARVPNKRLLLTADYVESGPRWRQRWRRWQWQRWRRSYGVRSVFERVPDEELPNLFDASDAVVVVRQNSMSSGVPSMAMTFGRFVIAPNIGSMPEYLAGTDNALYDQTSADDLARAMERAAVANREGVGRENARIAAGWGWEAIVRACLDALPPRAIVRRQGESKTQNSGGSPENQLEQIDPFAPATPISGRFEPIPAVAIGLSVDDDRGNDC